MIGSPKRTPKHAPLLIAVCADPGHEPLQQQASDLAHRCGTDLVEADDSTYLMHLAVTETGLEIRWRPADAPVGRPVRIDLLRLDTTSAQGRSKKQPLAKAIGPKSRRSDRGQLQVLDATAGLGEDAWLLASLGHKVTAIERHAVVAALLEDALSRAAGIRPQVAGRIELIHTDAFTWLESAGRLGITVDVVYLDPMYPPRRKSAGQRKATRMLRELVGDDPDADGLLEPALTLAPRVVVKRPLHAPALSRAPVATHKGKAVRYDVYSSGRGATI